jgi:hypothetical protein
MPFPLDDKYLRSAEEELGAKLPDGYRRAMMAANGGEVAGDVDATRRSMTAAGNPTTQTRRMERLTGQLLK